ncbi:cell division protein ZipA [uncultured Alteromonas sp.]|jgi:cell division protein ZipA|uniref:cell division protein ZipA n=1 Tax=uncultured Alteromonas sp. TaxID=179113 RepID=UPI0025FA7B9D|nr:cell division protein ZipA [uncultured Alteromonas sp.]
MEEELRLSLLLLGGFFILGVLAHGLWNIRKNSQAKKPQRRIEPEGWQDEAQDDEQSSQKTANDFDEFGIGEVRVVSHSVTESDDNEPVSSPYAAGNENINATDDDAEERQSGVAEATPEADENESEQEDAANETPKEKLYASVITNPKPQFNHDNVVELPDSVPAPPSFLLKEEAEPASEPAPTDVHDEFSLDTQPAPPEQKSATENDKADKATEAAAPTPVKKRSRTASRRRQEPRFGDDEQMQIDFDDSVKAAQAEAPQPAGQVEPEVLILNVRAPEDAPISGAALLPMLLTLGFKFGDQDIFHRHVNSNGKGPVLFSLANMFKPGNFDIDNLETFTTRGVSLFMLLPIEGDPHQVFNMMHNAARKIADEFNAQVLDGRRSVLSKQGLQQYVEKIRDFERKRMIARH